MSRYLLTHAYMVPFVLLTRALSSFFHLSEMLLNFNMTCRHVHCFLMATFWWMTLLHYAAILCCGVWWMLIGTPWVGAFPLHFTSSFAVLAHPVWVKYVAPLCAVCQVSESSGAGCSICTGRFVASCVPPVPP